MAAQEVGGIRDRIQPELIPDEDCWGNLQIQLHMISTLMLILYIEIRLDIDILYRVHQ